MVRFGREPSKTDIRWQLLLGLLLVMSLGCGGLAAVRATWVAYPPRKSLEHTPTDLDLDYEDVTFTTASGIEIVGWYIAPQNEAVVILTHGYGGNRSDNLLLAQMLVEQGYGVLLIDLVAHGESGGTRMSLNGQEVRAGVAYIVQRAAGADWRIGVWGFSLGGLGALQAAAQTPELLGVIADGPFPVARHEDMPPRQTLGEWFWWPYDEVQWQNWRLQGVTPALSTCQALQQSTSPVYLISGIENYGEYRVQRYYHAVAPERITLWEVAGAGHVESWATQRAAYERRVLEFLEQTLLAEPSALP